MKFPLFYVMTEEIQSGKIQNKILLFFQLHFMLNFIIHKIKKYKLWKTSGIPFRSLISFIYSGYTYNRQGFFPEKK